MELLGEADPPTAIFVAHDDLAIGALAGIADAGYGRGEVSVVGYDNTDLAAHPLIDLTSVDQQGEDMGEQAVRCCSSASRGGPSPGSYVAAPTLQVRSSTGPPLGHRPRDAGFETV